MHMKNLKTLKNILVYLIITYPSNKSVQIDSQNRSEPQKTKVRRGFEAVRNCRKYRFDRGHASLRLSQGCETLKKAGERNEETIAISPHSALKIEK